MEISNDFKNTLKEYVHVKTVIKRARADLSVLVKKEKELKPKVIDDMSNIEIDTINLSKGEKVSLKKRVSRGGITRKVIQNGLKEAFTGNEAEIERVLNCILDNREEKEIKSLSVTGLK